MATTNPPQSISDWYHSCIGSFENITTVVNNLATPELDSDTHEMKELALQRVRDQIGRFRVWAGNMGAHHRADSRMSLDYKLKEASRVHNMVLELLEELNSSLLEALKSAYQYVYLESGIGGVANNTTRFGSHTSSH